MAVKHSKESIIQNLHRWVNENGKVPREVEFHDDPDVPSRKAIRNLFGGFTNLLRASGYEVNRNIHTINGSRQKAQQMSEAELHGLIKTQGTELGRPPTHQECRAYLLERGLAIDPRNYLGKSWSQILLDCGFQPTRRSRSKEEELERLAAWIDRNGHVPTVVEIGADPSMPAATYYHKHFGSYERALKKLGHKAHRKSRWSDDELINILQTFANEHGRSPCRDDFANSLPYLSTFEKRFGGWNGALQAAGLDPNMQVYGYMYRTNHGHIRPSYTEGKCDDILGAFGIEHDHDVPYRNYIDTERFYNFDAVVQDTWFIEVAGMITRHQWTTKSGFRPNSMEAEYCATFTNKMNLLKENDFKGHIIVIFKDDDILDKLRPVIEGHELVNAAEGEVLAPRLYDMSQREQYTEAELVQNIKQVAEDLGRRPTLQDMNQPDLPYPSIYTKRKKWAHWLQDAGFNYIYSYTDDELMQNLWNLETELGRLPERKDVTNSTPCDMAYCRRFGSQWSTVMKRYEVWKVKLGAGGATRS